MEGWAVPSAHLPPGPAQPEATVSHDSTWTFFHPTELNLSPEDQLRRWAHLEQLQSIREQNCQEQVIHRQFCLQQQMHPELISQEPTSVTEDPVCQEPYFEASQLPPDLDMGRRKQAVAPVAVSQVKSSQVKLRRTQLFSLFNLPSLMDYLTDSPFTLDSTSPYFLRHSFVTLTQDLLAPFAFPSLSLNPSLSLLAEPLLLSHSF